MEATDVDDNAPTIYDATKACSDLFTAYLKEEHVSDSSRDRATDLFGRFKLWAEYVGALAAPKASLDARLVDHNDIKEMFLELLDMVQRNVRQDLIFSESQLTSQDVPGASDSDSDDEPLVFGLDAVNDALDRLHSLGVAVRKSSAIRSNTEQNADAATGSISSEALMYTRAMKVRFPDARYSLVERIGMSIYVRGKSMCYQQRHNRKLAISRDKPQPPVLAPAPEVAASTMYHPPVPPRATQEQHMPIRSADNFSDTNASRVRTEQLHAMINRPKTSPSQKSTGSSIREVGTEAFGYPKKPQKEPKLDTAPCPLCSEPLRLTGLTDEKWRAHVDKDIEPYVCLSDNCGKQLRFFSSYRCWKEHMQTEHGMDWPWTIHDTFWECDLDHGVNTHGNDTESFDDKDSFLRHLTKNHGDRLTTPQILVRARRNKVSRDREPFTCPLCNCVPDDERFIVAERPYELLFRHIARHLKAVSFFSLNYLGLDCSNESVQSGSVGKFDDGSSIAALSDRDDDFASIPDTITTGRGAHVDGLIFTSPDGLDDTIIWPPPLLPIEFTGPDLTLQKFAAAMREYAVSPSENQQPLGQSRHQDQTEKQAPSFEVDGQSDWTALDWALFMSLDCRDPRDYKKQFEQWKGFVIREVYLELRRDTSLETWLEDPHARVLWITGGAGTGKTMLMCGIINEICELAASSPLCYLFCDHFGQPSVDSVSVARGLIYMLVLQRPGLILHIRKNLGTVAEMPTEDNDILFATLTDMVTDGRAAGAILMVDDAYETLSEPNRSSLFVLIGQPTRVRWVITSRNSALATDDIGHFLENLQKSAVYRLDIETERLRNAVSTLIRHKVNNAAETHQFDTHSTEVAIQHLTSQHNGSFHWADMACRAVNVPGENILEIVFTLTADISSVYWQLIENIRRFVKRFTDIDTCRGILAVTSTAYRPLSIHELCTLCPTPNKLNTMDIYKFLGFCFDFLEVRNETVYFRDESLKDYITKSTPRSIFPLGLGYYYYNMASRSVNALSYHLRRNICRIKDPGCPRQEIFIPDDSPLHSIRYACFHWVDHLRDAGELVGGHDRETLHSALRGGGYIHYFLRRKLLQWVEALYLTEGAAAFETVLATLNTLRNLPFMERNVPGLERLIDNARDFVSTIDGHIGGSPLQIYVSAFLFGPKECRMMGPLQDDAFRWVWLESTAGGRKDAYGSPITFAVFSCDGKRLATASNDYTNHPIKLWDPRTGQLLKRLKGHNGGGIFKLVFSPDGRRLAAVEDLSMICIWDTESESRSPVLTVHDLNNPHSFTFSPHGLKIAYVDSFNEILSLDISTGSLVKRFGQMNHTSFGQMVAYDPNGSRIAVGSGRGSIGIFNGHSGRCEKYLMDGSDDLDVAIAISSDGKLLASGSVHGIVKVWDILSGEYIVLYHTGFRGIASVVFSQDANQVAVIAQDNLVTVWDVDSKKIAREFTGNVHSFCPETLDMGGGYSRYQVRDKWVVRDGIRLVYLPDSWNLKCLDIFGNCVALGDDKGDVHFLHFDEEIEF